MESDLARERSRTITAVSVSPFAYADEVEARHRLPAAGLRSNLHQVGPVTTQGAVVGGADRFARADVDDLGDSVHQAEVSAHLTHRTGLTPRDVVVLGFLAQGWTTADIARELAYAESTIKKEVHFIVQRLGARNRTHAVAMAIRGTVI